MLKTTALGLMLTASMIACGGGDAPPPAAPTTPASSNEPSAATSAASPPMASASAAPVETPPEKPAAPAAKDPAAAKEDAKKTMQIIARDVVASYERETMDAKGKIAPRAICPSAAAVPAKLDPSGGAYEPKDSDWKDPGWDCLRFALVAPMTFQFEYKVTGKKFVISARRAGKDAAELRLKGEVDDAKKKVKLDSDIEEVKK